MWSEGLPVVLCWFAVGYLAQAYSSALLPTESATAAITASKATKCNRKKGNILGLYLPTYSVDV